MNDLYQMNKSISHKMGDKLKKFCAPIVNHFGISHFYHFIFTDLDQFASIGLNQNWHDRLYSGSEGYGYRVLPYYRNAPCQKVSFTQAYQDESWEHMSILASNEFNVNFGLQLIMKTKEGIEGFGFGLDTNDLRHHMTLLNDLPVIHSFIKEYRNEYNNTLLRNNLVDVSSLIAPYLCKKPAQQIYSRLEFQSPFTKRETEIIQTMLNGNYTAENVAEELFLSKRTVEHHLERIKEKLDCPSKADLLHKLHELESMGYLV